MARSRSILVVDDNKGILASLQYLLGDRFAHVLCLSSPQGILSLLERQAVDVVLLDMNFSAGLNSGGEGLFYLQEIKARHPHIPVVLFTAFADISLAVEGLKRGAADFVVKPYDNARLLQTLEEACATKDGTRPKRNAPTKNGTDMYWGTSAAMQRLRTQVERCSATDANILITGENGTGKEVLAREIHAASHRKGGPLIAVDMGAIAPTLFESELFGHVKGAFTDARQDHEGRFEAARGGTLFLDEIGNLPLHLQAKLLTALQSRQVVRVGSNTPADVDIRLVCATNKDLPAMVECGEFREDLLYRINHHPPALARTARAPGGHPAPGPPLPATLRPRIRAGRRRLLAQGGRTAGTPPLVRQHPRTATRRGTGRHPRGRPPHPARTAEPVGPHRTARSRNRPAHTGGYGARSGETSAGLLQGKLLAGSIAAGHLATDVV